MNVYFKMYISFLIFNLGVLLNSSYICSTTFYSNNGFFILAIIILLSTFRNVKEISSTKH